MRTVKIDASNIWTPAALQRYIQHVFDFPAYYGRNLDALYDMLRTLDRETHIVLCGGANPSDEMAAYLPRLALVLEDAAAENARLSLEVL